jgi:hypothetical protein
MEHSLTFTNHQAEILLYWYENAVEKSERFGTAHISFPQEEFVVHKLRRNSLSSRFDIVDFEIIWSWMEKVVDMGTAAAYFPFEEETIEKLCDFRKEIESLEPEENPDRERAIREADRLLNQKRQTGEKMQNIDTKITRIHFKYDAELFREKLKKARSLKEKISAANDLKKALDDLNKKLGAKDKNKDDE